MTWYPYFTEFYVRIPDTYDKDKFLRALQIIGCIFWSYGINLYGDDGSDSGSESGASSDSVSSGSVSNNDEVNNNEVDCLKFFDHEESDEESDEEGDEEGDEESDEEDNEEGDQESDERVEVVANDDNEDILYGNDEDDDEEGVRGNANGNEIIRYVIKKFVTDGNEDFDSKVITNVETEYDICENTEDVKKRFYPKKNHMCVYGGYTGQDCIIHSNFTVDSVLPTQEMFDDVVANCKQFIYYGNYGADVDNLVENYMDSLARRSEDTPVRIDVGAPFVPVPIKHLY
jgi:hypothetical protein